MPYEVLPTCSRVGVVLMTKLTVAIALIHKKEGRLHAKSILLAFSNKLLVLLSATPFW